MNLRTARRWLWLASGLLAAGLAASTWALLLAPLETSEVSAASSRHRSHSLLETASPAARPLAAYTVIHHRPLRKPLFDPKPKAEVKAKPKPPELQATLVGTAVEPGFTYGLFQTRDGQTHLIRIGQTVGGATLTAVTKTSATVTLKGHTLTLTIQSRD